MGGRQAHKKTRGFRNPENPRGERNFGELAGVANLFNDACHCVAWLCANSKPFVGFLEIEGVVFSVSHWVVGPKLFDIAAITALAAIDSDNFIIRAIFGTFASKTECNHSIGGGPRNLGG